MSILERWIKRRDDIAVAYHGRIVWTSSMHAGSYYGLIGLSLEEAEDMVKKVRQQCGTGYQDSIKLLEDNNWDLEKTIKENKTPINPTLY